MTDESGRKAGSKFLIVHADDVGMAHSVNEATFAAFEAGAITSASVMTPCPCFDEAAWYARGHPGVDLGIHLTITSEWRAYKWRPLTAMRPSTAITDEEGQFRPWVRLGSVSQTDLTRELTAQVLRATDAGIVPTHIDSHMFALFTRRDFADSYHRVAAEFRLPCLVPPAGTRRVPELTAPVTAVIQAHPQVPPTRWKEFYLEALKSIQPGITQIIVHLGYDDSELQEITNGQEGWGAAWRQRDFEVVMDLEFQSVIREEGIRLIGWDGVAACRAAITADGG